MGNMSEFDLGALTEGWRAASDPPSHSSLPLVQFADLVPTSHDLLRCLTFWKQPGFDRDFLHRVDLAFGYDGPPILDYERPNGSLTYGWLSALFGALDVAERTQRLRPSIETLFQRCLMTAQIAEESPLRPSVTLGILRLAYGFFPEQVADAVRQKNIKVPQDAYGRPHLFFSDPKDLLEGLIETAAHARFDARHPGGADAVSRFYYTPDAPTSPAVQW